jgi:hypothetical protein
MKNPGTSLAMSVIALEPTSPLVISVTLGDALTGSVAIQRRFTYTVTGLAFCQMDEILAWLHRNSSI